MKYSWILCFFFLGCASFQSSSFKLRDYKEYELKNGLKVLFVEDQKLPYLNISLYLLSGALEDPMNKSGTTQLMMSLLDKGTFKRSSEKIAEEIESLGADYGYQVSHDYVSVTLQGLSFHEDALLNNFVDIVFQPTFEKKEFDRSRRLLVSSLRQSFNSSAFLRERATASFYFDKSPYSRNESGSVFELQKINIDDVKKSYKKHFAPNGNYLVIVGQYSQNLKKRLLETFSNWKSIDLKTSQNFQPAPPVKGIEILIVNKSDLTQAEISFTQKGVTRKIPDYMSAQVANSIFGQGFSSRIMDRIRDQLGLTYNISSQFDIRFKESVFSVETFTRLEKVGFLLEEYLKTYNTFFEKGVSEKEVEVAKNSMKGRFPLLLETAEKTALNLIVLRMFGIDDEYLTEYSKNLERVSVRSVNLAIQKYFDPKNIKIVIVGPAEKIKPQVEKIGSVQIKDFKDFIN